MIFLPFPHFPLPHLRNNPLIKSDTILVFRILRFKVNTVVVVVVVWSVSQGLNVHNMHENYDKRVDFFLIKIYFVIII